MDKIVLDIIGLSYSQTQSGAYALVLGEQGGKRRLPIIIGGFEAQAIAIALENMTPSRPLTHDLFKSFSDSFNVSLKEVIIYNLLEGIFYSKLICKNGSQEVEIDARTSDAIALAVRFKCPVYTFESILSKAGVILDEDEEKMASPVKKKQRKKKKSPEELIGDSSVEELKDMLDKAITQEDYELASRIRDEITSRKGKN
ncbi:MAG: bifunctional nuclease family protein [Vicingaceae bacterium]